MWDLHSGDCVRTIRQGSFPHLVRLHFFLWGWGVGLGCGGRKTYLDCPQCQCAGVWLLCTTLQVLDYPYCWALGSGGRGAVWDLSSGKIVNYFGSNDRWPGWFCFDNFSDPQAVLGAQLKWSVSTSAQVLISDFFLSNNLNCRFMAASEANYKLRKFTRVYFCNTFFLQCNLIISGAWSIPPADSVSHGCKK